MTVPREILEGAWQMFIFSLLNRAEEILSTDIWFHFQSVEMMLKKPRGRGRCLFVVKMMLKQNIAKRGAWETFS